jgi:hypothetical protein
VAAPVVALVAHQAGAAGKGEAGSPIEIGLGRFRPHMFREYGKVSLCFTRLRRVPTLFWVAEAPQVQIGDAGLFERRGQLPLGKPRPARDRRLPDIEQR